MYTTHGLMTPEDMADYRDLYDLDQPDPECPRCGGPLASEEDADDDECGGDE